ncbi:hypothetical protein SELMODRAFT_418974 [Selaginella moellendorffii]|uniref:Uncharacterized protein n=1 Tax=Selaginella moellendorffii TaxID=88036 RepID=D8S7E5_SELML|nr:hypothetical protein SELMODRAFT_418974 [Selaginella moellendorffii]
MEEDEVDGLPSHFSDLDYSSNMDSDNNALLEAFFNFLQLRGFGSLVAFGTWMHLKILKTKTTTYLICYLRISKPTLYKYVWLVDLNWRGVYYKVPLKEVAQTRGLSILDLVVKLKDTGLPTQNLNKEVYALCHIHCDFALYLKKDISHWVATWNLHEVRPYRCGDYFRPSHVPANLFQPMEREYGIMPAIGGKDIEDVLGPFLSNIEGATLSEALGIVRNLTFFMHQEGLNLDKQYLLHLDLTMECAMIDVVGVDLPLYTESALLTATLVK